MEKNTGRLSLFLKKYQINNCGNWKSYGVKKRPVKFTTPLKLFLLFIGFLGICVAFLGLYYPRTWNCGSSVITDNGWSFDSPGRYIVNVGKIDLSQKKISSWELCMLPEKKMTCGFRIKLSGDSGFLEDRKLTQKVIHKIVLSLKVYNSKDYLLFENAGNISKDWIWSGPDNNNTAFVYGNSTYGTNEITSSFSASPDETYRVVVEVMNTTGDINVVATIILKDLPGS